MTPSKKKQRTDRVKKMNTVLRKLYPEAKIALHYTTDFECLVAVQLSAQCTDERVNKVTATLFKKYKTIEDYASAAQSVFEQDIYQTGFFRNKAKNIIAAAKMIQEELGGVLPRTMEEMVRIPGVARKTANVVLSTLYGIHEGIAVDTHVRRFAIRFDLSDHTDPVRIERDLMEIMPREEWWGFNHRLVHYGRDYCPARKHECKDHPLTNIYPKAEQVWPKAR
ncbi:endonuclease III [Candidatus Kaiserbacteria bacterium]|nr:endonuclease III [Candidatus Kaiserbacteria bacterium]